MGHGTLAPDGVEAIDREALARDLSREVEGEVRFDAGTRAIYSHDSSNYRQPPLGAVIPRHADDVVAAVAACRAHGASAAAARLRDQPLRRDDQRRRRPRHLQVHARDRRDRPGAAGRQGAARRDPRPARRPHRARARPHLRPRYLDPRIRDLRRDDRQQLLRRPLGDGGTHRRQRRGAGDRHLRRRAYASRPDERGGARADRRGRRPPRRDLPSGCATCANATPPWSASATRTSRAASPATTSTSCCPRRASTSPAPWSARRARWRPCWRRPCGWSIRRRPARCWCSATRASSRPPTTCPRSSATARSGWRGSTAG